jgi:hypothetical protein
MRSEQIAGWTCSGCEPIRARAHYVALSAATPSPINIRRTAISRRHTNGQAEQQPPLAPVKSPALRFRPGEDKCQPGPRISEQSPVLTQYRKQIRENIRIFPPSCGEPLGEATDSRSPSSSAGSLWRIPIWGEREAKKAAVEKRGCGNFVRVARIR